MVVVAISRDTSPFNTQKLLPLQRRGSQRFRLRGSGCPVVSAEASLLVHRQHWKSSTYKAEG